VKNKQEPLYRINEQITAKEVRIVQDPDASINNTIMSLEEALALAEKRGEDLVEIAPQANPPACRIIEYSKFLFQLKKKQKEIKSRQHQTVVKEIRFGPNTDDHDLQFKIRHAREFLQEGNKVKAWIHFQGRSILYVDRGEQLLEKFAEALSDVAKVEIPPKLDGKRMSILLTPLKSGSKKS